MSEHGGGADDRASWSARPQEPATKPGTIPSSGDEDGAAQQPDLYSLKILGTELTAKQTQQLIIALCVHTARSIRGKAVLCRGAAGHLSTVCLGLSPSSALADAQAPLPAARDAH